MLTQVQGSTLHRHVFCTFVYDIGTVDIPLERFTVPLSWGSLCVGIFVYVSSSLCLVSDDNPFDLQSQYVLAFFKPFIGFQHFAACSIFCCLSAVKSISVTVLHVSLCTKNLITFAKLKYMQTTYLAKNYTTWSDLAVYNIFKPFQFRYLKNSNDWIIFFIITP